MLCCAVLCCVLGQRQETSCPFSFSPLPLFPLCVCATVPDATVYVGGLDERVTEPLLWELFLQAGPVGECEAADPNENVVSSCLVLCVSTSNIRHTRAHTHTHRHTQSQTHRQTHTHTHAHRHTHRHTRTHAHTLTHRHTRTHTPLCFSSCCWLMSLAHLLCVLQ